MIFRPSLPSLLVLQLKLPNCKTRPAQREAEANREDFGEDSHSRVVEELARTLPRLDTRAMASLAWMYTQGRNPKYSREIFRQLRAAHEQQKRVDAGGKT